MSGEPYAVLRVDIYRVDVFVVVVGQWVVDEACNDRARVVAVAVEFRAAAAARLCDVEFDERAFEIFVDPQIARRIESELPGAAAHFVPRGNMRGMVRCLRHRVFRDRLGSGVEHSYSGAVEFGEPDIAVGALLHMRRAGVILRDGILLKASILFSRLAPRCRVRRNKVVGATCLRLGKRARLETQDEIALFARLPDGARIHGTGRFIYQNSGYPRAILRNIVAALRARPRRELHDARGAFLGVVVAALPVPDVAVLRHVHVLIREADIGLPIHRRAELRIYVENRVCRLNVLVVHVLPRCGDERLDPAREFRFYPEIAALVERDVERSEMSF